MDNKETNSNEPVTQSELCEQSGKKEGLLGTFDEVPKDKPLDRTDSLLARIQNFYEKNGRRR